MWQRNNDQVTEEFRLRTVRERFPQGIGYSLHQVVSIHGQSPENRPGTCLQTMSSTAPIVSGSRSHQLMAARSSVPEHCDDRSVFGAVYDCQTVSAGNTAAGVRLGRIVEFWTVEHRLHSCRLHPHLLAPVMGVGRPLPYGCGGTPHHLSPRTPSPSLSSSAS